MITDVLYNELVPHLTCFTNNPKIFHEAFEENKKLGVPIKNILELGVCRIQDRSKPLLFGQSTKTLLVLADHYQADKFVSLDIDADCRETVELCTRWVTDLGSSFPGHKFVQSASLDFDVKIEFPNGVDFIFLDTNHDDSYPETLGFAGTGGAGMTYKELEYYSAFLTASGRMFIHDTFEHYVPVGYGNNTDGALAKFRDLHPEFAFREHNSNQHGLGELVRRDGPLWSAAKYA